MVVNINDYSDAIKIAKTDPNIPTAIEIGDSNGIIAEYSLQLISGHNEWIKTG
jgi:hypothetical protein